MIWILRIGGQQCYPGLPAPTHLHVACDTVVDRPTQLVCISDIHFLISICICQHTNTKDIGRQSPSDTATFAQVHIAEHTYVRRKLCLSFLVVHQRKLLWSYWHFIKIHSLHWEYDCVDTVIFPLERGFGVIKIGAF